MLSKLSPPFEAVAIIRVLVALIILLFFVANYYHSTWQVEMQKNIQLQTQLEEKL